MKKFEKFNNVLLCIGVTFFALSIFSVYAQDPWVYKFDLDSEFRFPTSPKTVGFYEVSDKTPISEETAIIIAKGFGFVDDLGNPIKPTIDYFYQVPAYEPPSQREKTNKRTEQIDDEKPRDQGSELPKQPEAIWPPEGAKQQIKTYNFVLGNKFLSINENNGAIAFSNNDYLNFAGLPKGGLPLTDEEAWKMAQTFIKTVNLPQISFDPANSEPKFTDVEVFNAELETGAILDSFICMKEIKLMRMIDGYPVVGGEGSIRMTLGMNIGREQDIQVASFSRLVRTIEKSDTETPLYTPSEAFAFLKDGNGLMNNKVRFIAEGTIKIKDAYLAYYAPTGNEDVDYLTPVWVFTGYDSEIPENEVQFFVNAKKEAAPDETFVKITTDKTYYTPNDSQQVSIEIYCKDAENLILYVGFFAPDGYFYSFPFWTHILFPIVATLPAGFHLAPFEFLNFNPIGTGPYNSSGHFAYFALLMNRTTYELICPISVAEFDIE